MSGLETRLDMLHLRIGILELTRRIDALEAASSLTAESEAVGRVRAHLKSAGVHCFVLSRVPADYYQRSLIDRARILQACSVNQLCKTIVFENKLCEERDCADPSNSRLYAVVVQYTAKVNADKLRDAVHKLRHGPNRVPRSKIHFHLAAQGACVAYFII